MSCIQLYPVAHEENGVESTEELPELGGCLARLQDKLLLCKKSIVFLILTTRNIKKILNTIYSSIQTTEYQGINLTDAQDPCPGNP